MRYWKLKNHTPTKKLVGDAGFKSWKKDEDQIDAKYLAFMPLAVGRDEKEHEKFGKMVNYKILGYDIERSEPITISLSKSNTYGKSKFRHEFEHFVSETAPTVVCIKPILDGDFYRATVHTAKEPTEHQVQQFHACATEDLSRYLQYLGELETLKDADPEPTVVDDDDIPF